MRLSSAHLPPPPSSLLLRLPPPLGQAAAMEPLRNPCCLKMSSLWACRCERKQQTSVFPGSSLPGSNDLFSLNVAVHTHTHAVTRTAQSAVSAACDESSTGTGVSRHLLLFRLAFFFLSLFLRTLRRKRSSYWRRATLRWWWWGG